MMPQAPPAGSLLNPPAQTSLNPTRLIRGWGPWAGWNKNMTALRTAGRPNPAAQLSVGGAGTQATSQGVQAAAQKLAQLKDLEKTAAMVETVLGLEKGTFNKRAFLSAIPGAMIGGAAGGAFSPQGRTGEGVGRGVLRGMVTGLGADLGGALGARLGLGAGEAIGGSEGAGVGMLTGMGLGYLGGGLGGYYAAPSLTGMSQRPEWVEDYEAQLEKKKKDKEPVKRGSLIGIGTDAALGGILGGAMAPGGTRLHNAGRGAVRGAMTGVGGSLGGALGGTIGQAFDDGPGHMAGSVLGESLGTVAGELGGFAYGPAALRAVGLDFPDRPDYLMQADEKEKKKQEKKGDAEGEALGRLLQGHIGNIMIRRGPDGPPMGVGSGVAVGPGQWLTAGHVTDHPGASFSVMDPGKARGVFNAEGPDVGHALKHLNDAAPATVKWQDRDMDLSVLNVARYGHPTPGNPSGSTHVGLPPGPGGTGNLTELKLNNAPGIPLMESENYDPKETFYNMGFSPDRPREFTSGHIVNPHASSEGYPRWETTIPGWHGDSGGAVVNSKGQLAGSLVEYKPNLFREAFWPHSSNHRDVRIVPASVIRHVLNKANGLPSVEPHQASRLSRLWGSWRDAVGPAMSYGIPAALGGLAGYGAYSAFRDASHPDEKPKRKKHANAGCGPMTGSSTLNGTLGGMANTPMQGPAGPMGGTLNGMAQPRGAIGGVAQPLNGQPTGALQPSSLLNGTVMGQGMLPTPIPESLKTSSWLDQLWVNAFTDRLGGLGKLAMGLPQASQMGVQHVAQGLDPAMTGQQPQPGGPQQPGMPPQGAPQQGAPQLMNPLMMPQAQPQQTQPVPPGAPPSTGMPGPQFPQPPPPPLHLTDKPFTTKISQDRPILPKVQYQGGGKTYVPGPAYDMRGDGTPSWPLWQQVGSAYQSRPIPQSPWEESSHIVDEMDIPKVPGVHLHRGQPHVPSTASWLRGFPNWVEDHGTPPTPKGLPEQRMKFPPDEVEPKEPAIGIGQSKGPLAHRPHIAEEVLKPRSSGAQAALQPPLPLPSGDHGFRSSTSEPRSAKVEPAQLAPPEAALPVNEKGMAGAAQQATEDAQPAAPVEAPKTDWMQHLKTWGPLAGGLGAAALLGYLRRRRDDEDAPKPQEAALLPQPVQQAPPSLMPMVHASPRRKRREHHAHKSSAIADEDVAARTKLAGGIGDRISAAFRTALSKATKRPEASKVLTNITLKSPSAEQAALGISRHPEITHSGDTHVFHVADGNITRGGWDKLPAKSNPWRNLLIGAGTGTGVTLGGGALYNHLTKDGPQPVGPPPPRLEPGDGDVASVPEEHLPLEAPPPASRLPSSPERMPDPEAVEPSPSEPQATPDTAPPPSSPTPAGPNWNLVGGLGGSAALLALLGYQRRHRDGDKKRPFAIPRPIVTAPPAPQPELIEPSTLRSTDGQSTSRSSDAGHPRRRRSDA